MIGRRKLALALAAPSVLWITSARSARPVSLELAINAHGSLIYSSGPFLVPFGDVVRFGTLPTRAVRSPLHPFEADPVSAGPEQRAIYEAAVSGSLVATESIGGETAVSLHGTLTLLLHAPGPAGPEGAQVRLPDIRSLSLSRDLHLWPGEVATMSVGEVGDLPVELTVQVGS